MGIGSERARTELARRGKPIGAEDPDAVTAAEWRAEHHANHAREDPHRQITADHDLADQIQQRAAAHAAAEAVPDDAPVLETAVPDIRDSDVGHLNDEPSRIPTPAESEDAVTHARNVLREIEQRRALDERHAAEEHRFIQLNQWAADDRADATAAANVDALGRN